MSDHRSLNRRTFLEQSGKAVLAGTATVSTPQVGWSADNSTPAVRMRPNILLIITDDQGYGDIGFHGNDKVRTPNLDRLAAESTRFTQFHVSPVCAPTRASLMTGRYNYRTRVVDTYIGRAMMDPDEVTLAEMLGGAGYQTGIFGKWHLGDNYPMRACDKGFQESLVHRGGGIAQPSDPPGNSYFDPVLLHNGKDERYIGYCTDIFTDAAINFIEANRDRPFFTYLATNCPHTPLQIGDEYVDPYRQMGLDETTARVYGMVTNIDDNLGRLFAKLKELGLEENTFVIFLTDNGPQQERYNSGMRDLKGTVYEGGIRVPCFMRRPGQFKAGKEIDRLAAHIDIVPTLLELCHVPAPANVKIDGRSLVPLLMGDGESWSDRMLFFQWHRGDVPEPFKQAAVRNQRYKLVNGEELYDLDVDPAEQNDIAASRPDLVQSMRQAYEAWYADVSSSRGYDPPRIYLGTPHENPVILTRQDWRGPRAGWGKEFLGYWEVKVAEPGVYAIDLLIDPADVTREAVFKLGDIQLQRPVHEKSNRVRYSNVRLPAGDGRLEAWVAEGDNLAGVLYVHVTKMDEM